MEHRQICRCFVAGSVKVRGRSRTGFHQLTWCAALPSPRMGFTIIAVALGLVVGLIAGGRPSNMGRRPLRAIIVLGAAVVLLTLPQLVDVSGSTGLVCVLASYVLLLLFAVANVRFVGMP